jgi:hypothetical protein
MQIKFNLKNAKTGERKVWVYPDDANFRIDDWFSPGALAGEPEMAIVNFEEVQRDDPTFALLDRLPHEGWNLKRFLDWWFNEAGDDERKSFVYLYGEQGWSRYGAMDSAYDVVWTGVKGDDYKGLGEYVAEELGLWKYFRDPEKAKESFNFEEFGKTRFEPKYELSATFNEWLVVTYEIIYLGDR